MADKLQFKVRLDAELHRKITLAAERSGRSVNSEIVNRLDLSFISNQYSEELLTADQASKVADQAVEDGYEILLKKCMHEITKEAQVGLRRVYIDTGYDDLYEDDEIMLKVVEPVIKKLRELDFEAELLDCTKISVKFS
jgi:hypothetical protein